jgi:hypothetical protein
MKTISLIIDCATESEMILTALKLRQLMPDLGDRLTAHTYQHPSFGEDCELTVTIGSTDNKP